MVLPMSPLSYWLPGLTTLMQVYLCVMEKDSIVCLLRAKEAPELCSLFSVFDFDTPKMHNGSMYYAQPSWSMQAPFYVNGAMHIFPMQHCVCMFNISECLYSFSMHTFLQKSELCSWIWKVCMHRKYGHCCVHLKWQVHILVGSHITLAQKATI